MSEVAKSERMLASVTRLDTMRNREERRILEAAWEGLQGAVHQAGRPVFEFWTVHGAVESFAIFPTTPDRTQSYGVIDMERLSEFFGVSKWSARTFTAAVTSLTPPLLRHMISAYDVYFHDPNPSPRRRPMGGRLHRPPETLTDFGATKARENAARMQRFASMLRSSSSETQNPVEEHRAGGALARASIRWYVGGDFIPPFETMEPAVPITARSRANARWRMDDESFGGPDFA